MSLDHLSYSSITAFMACGANWKYKYIDKRPSYSTPALCFGSAIHGTIETHLTTGEALLDAWPVAWAKASTDESRSKIVWGIESPGDYLKEGYRILSVPSVKAGIESIQIGKDADGKALIEQKVELRIPGVPIPVIGYIDVQTADGVPGDIKTSGKAWTADQAQKSLQSLFYLAALNQAGRNVPGGVFRHYVITKTKSPTFTVFEHKHNLSESIWLFGVIRNVWRAIESGAFVENPDSWKCNPTYCDYWGDCRGRFVK